MKKMKKRQTPDIRQAINAGVREGVKTCIIVSTFTLVDRFGWDIEQIQDFAAALNYEFDCINDGTNKLSDIRGVLDKEYGLKYGEAGG